MLFAADLDHRRVLLVGPACRAWFLGERIYGWERGSIRCQVLLSPLLSMFWIVDLVDEELTKSLEGFHDFEDLTIRSRRTDYTSFIPKLLGHPCLLVMTSWLRSIEINLSTYIC